jgi:hypothetical protein
MNFDPDSRKEDEELENAEEMASEDEGNRFLDEEEESVAATEDTGDVPASEPEPEMDFPPAGEPMEESPEGPPLPPPTNFDFAYPQLFFFLFSSLAMAVGCLLPWERTFLKGNLTGADSIGGGFLLVFALYGVISGFFNIYHRKMIVWPVILAAVDGAIIGWQRVVQLLGDLDLTSRLEGLDGFAKIQQTVKGYAQALGPGLYLVTIFSTLVLLSIIVSVFKGAKEDSRRKAEEREARAESRRARKSSS